MLYTKKIEDITYQDVVNFCDESIGENISLDYKEAIDSSLAKTIVAMANTWGGLIIIGVEDEDSKPKLPIKGIEFKEHLREQINNIILGNITPPVFPEIQVCKSQDATTAFIVIRVSQSNTTPHAIKNNTKVYIRTNTSSEPEELATIDRVLWLVDKRKKSIDLKNGFFNTADLRLRKLTKKEIPIQFADTIFASMPLYPFEALIDYRKLKGEILEKIEVRGFNSFFPRNRYYASFEPVQNGSFSLIHNEETGYVSYEELNHFGFFYHREDMAHTEKTSDGQVNLCYPISLLVQLDLFFQSICNFYTILGYWGYIEIKVIMDNIGRVTFTDLPAPRGKMKIENVRKIPIDNKLIFIREVTFKDLQEKRMDLLIDIFTKLTWSLGFSWIDENKIKELFEKGW